MDEARRFARYLFPSLSFAIELILLLYIFEPAEIKKQAILLNSLGAGEATLLLGLTALVLVGLGFIMSILYHFLFKIVRPLNYYPLLRDAIKMNWITLRNRQKDCLITEASEKLTASDTWSILGAYYHARIHKKEFAEAHKRIESLNDTLHGLGTTLIGSLMVMLFFLGIYAFDMFINKTFCITWCTEATLISIVISDVMFCNYLLTAREVNRFADTITSQFMYIEANTSGPIDIYVSELIPVWQTVRKVKQAIVAITSKSKL